MVDISKYLKKKPFVRELVSSTRLEEPQEVDANSYKEISAPQRVVCEVTQDDFIAEFDPRSHKINNKKINPDKIIYNEDGKVIGEEKIARVAIGYQKMISMRQAVHLVGNPPVLTATKDSDNDLFIKYKEYRRLKGIHGAIYLGIKSALDVGDSAIFFFRDKKGKLRWKVWSYKDGNSICPTYENDGVTLKAFARRYYSIINGKSVDTVDIINNKTYKTYVKKGVNTISRLDKILDRVGLGTDWEEVSSVSHGFTQVPVAYHRNEDVAWGDGQELIDTIERALSDHREANAYFAFGIMFLTGDIEVLPPKNRQGKTMIGAEGSNASMLTQKEVSGGFKFEFDTYKKELFTLTGTVVIDPEQFKGGDITGAAIRNYYNPAIQYAKDKAPLYYDFLNQIESITMEAMGMEYAISTKMKQLNVISEIDIYVPLNTMEMAQKIMFLRQSGAISARTAQEINEYATPDEVDRMREEAEKELEIQTVTNIE